MLNWTHLCPHKNYNYRILAILRQILKRRLQCLYVLLATTYTFQQKLVDLSLTLIRIFLFIVPAFAMHWLGTRTIGRLSTASHPKFWWKVGREEMEWRVGGKFTSTLWCSFAKERASSHGSGPQVRLNRGRGMFRSRFSRRFAQGSSMSTIKASYIGIWSRGTSFSLPMAQ